MIDWLRGKRIELRPVEPEDLALLLHWENDRINWEISGTLLPFSKDLMKRYIENTHLNIYQTGQYRFVIEEKQSGEAVGAADIFDFDPFNRRAGLGILIGNSEKRKRGLATECIELLKEYCFRHLDLIQLYCNVLSENENSIKLFARAGFALSGTRKNWIRSGSIYKDQHFMQLFREDVKI